MKSLSLYFYEIPIKNRSGVWIVLNSLHQCEVNPLRTFVARTLILKMLRDHTRVHMLETTGGYLSRFQASEFASMDYAVVFENTVTNNSV